MLNQFILTFSLLIIIFSFHFLSFFFFLIIEFIPCMDKLFDESILIGSGYTARETLRYGRKVGMSS